MRKTRQWLPSTHSKTWTAPSTKNIWGTEDNFVRVLHKIHLEYSGSTTLGLLTHLYVTYMVIANADWIVNGKRFREVHSPTNPLEFLWNQINNSFVYGNTISTPNSTNQAVKNVHQLIFNARISRQIVRSGISKQKMTPPPPI